MKHLSRLLSGLFLLLPLAGNADDDLLEPEQAFPVQVVAVDEQALHIEWNIADDYYLYKERFGFKGSPSGIALGSAEFPAATIKEDEFFGTVETFSGKTTVILPYTRSSNTSQPLKLEIAFQGCNEPLGVCYPPQREHFTLELPAGKPLPAAASATAAPPTLLSKVQQSLSGNPFSNQEDDLLEPDDAFRFSATGEKDRIQLRWEIAPGHYLYADKFSFRIEDGSDAELGAVKLPAGEEKDDEFFGRIEVFHGVLEVTVPLQHGGDGTLRVGYQGCNEVLGICYPPMQKEVDLAAGSIATASPGSTAIQPAFTAPLSEQDSLAAALASSNRWLTVLTFLGLGLLLAFTPCVFPMIPILSSIIVGQGEQLTTRRAFTMSLVYVLAMALTYTVAGVLAGLFGANLQAAFQNVWILGAFSLIFVLLALSMFGFYELQLPSALQTRLSEVSNRQQSGNLIGVGIMGLLSALIVGPCVAPPLMGALIYIGQTGDALLGGLALFALSIGMGFPLLLIGTSAGKLLPRAGGWMDAVKGVFGVLLLAVALWMLERVLPASLTMFAWALLLIISAIYMGALEPLQDKLSGWYKLWKGIGIALLIQGALILLGAASGGTDPLQPLHGLNFAGGGPAGQSARLEFRTVKTVADLQQAVEAAAAEGKPAMLDFYADWCVSCKEFEKYTFSDARVIAGLANTVLLQADVTANDAEDQALLRHFKLIGPPSILFFGKDGEERSGYRVVGFMKADAFHEHLKNALGDNAQISAQPADR